MDCTHCSSAVARALQESPATARRRAARLPGESTAASSASSGSTAGSGTTAEDGTWSVKVAAGEYHVRFDDPGGGYLRRWYGAAGAVETVAGATLVVVGATDVTGIDATLPAALHIRGTVHQAGGVKPSVGTSLVASTLAGTFVGATSTGIDGSYVLPVGPGTYTVSLSVEGSPTLDGWIGTGGFTLDEAAAAQIVVAAADVSGKDVTLPALRHIGGTVTRTGGGALQGIEVTAYADGGGWSWSTVTTDSLGRYSVTVYAGTCTLGFSDPADLVVPGYWSAAGLVADGADAEVVDVTAADATGKDVVMTSALHIRGQLARAGGHPADGVSVEVYLADGTTFAASTVSDASGDYSVRVDPGDYALLFGAGGPYVPCWYAAAACQATAGTADTVTVTAADHTGIDAVLTGKHSITGVVLDGADAALPGIRVTAYDGTGSAAASAITDAGGGYALPVADGTYHVAFRHPIGVLANGWYTGA
ncbi:MAG: carboxypeptidase-like regulatory domain-containing protein, partial [Chloroflexota bacterium]